MVGIKKTNGLRIASMVVDNLEWVNYRVEYNSGRLLLFDLVIWFGGDEYQCQLLEEKKKNCIHPNIKIVNLNHKIKNGADFAYMQDLSFQYIKENYDYSICAFQSADVLLTELGQRKVDEWIDNSHDDFAVFLSMNNKFFCETGYGIVVFQIFRSGVEYKTNNGLSDNIRFCNGEQIVKNKYWGQDGWSETEHLNYVIDNGYINPEAAFQKAKNWSRLCYGDANTPELLSLYSDKRAFVKRYIELVRGEFHGFSDKKLIPVKYEGEYKRMIDDLNIKDDYDFVCSVVSEINSKN